MVKLSNLSVGEYTKNFRLMKTVIKKNYGVPQGSGYPLQPACRQRQVFLLKGSKKDFRFYPSRFNSNRCLKK
jgi:hypothetical protein